MQPSGKERAVMRLKPVLGPVQLVFYGVGVIVGAGSTRSSAAQRGSRNKAFG
jgi:hypothetical protein